MSSSPLKIDILVYNMLKTPELTQRANFQQVARRSECSVSIFDLKTPSLMYHMLIKDSFMIFVIKCRPLLPENLLLGIFRQLLGSEAINIES